MPLVRPEQWRTRRERAAERAHAQPDSDDAGPANREKIVSEIGPDTNAFSAASLVIIMGASSASQAADTGAPERTTGGPSAVKVSLGDRFHQVGFRDDRAVTVVGRQFDRDPTAGHLTERVDEDLLGDILAGGIDRAIDGCQPQHHGIVIGGTRCSAPCTR